MTETKYNGGLTILKLQLEGSRKYLVHRPLFIWQYQILIFHHQLQHLHELESWIIPYQSHCTFSPPMLLDLPNWDHTMPSHAVLFATDAAELTSWRMHYTIPSLPVTLCFVMIPYLERHAKQLDGSHCGCRGHMFHQSQRNASNWKYW